MNHMAHAKNGSGSREVLIAFYERRSQFTKSGITFERIQFELIWSLTGNSGLIKKDLATTSRLSRRFTETPYKITAALRSAPRSRPRLSATDRLIPRTRGHFQMRNQAAPGLPDNYLFPPR